MQNYLARNTDKQKQDFINYILMKYPNSSVMEINGNKNIIIGSLEQCKYIVGAHYDTPKCQLINHPQFTNIFLYVGYLYLCTVLGLTLNLFITYLLLKTGVWVLLGLPLETFLTLSAVVGIILVLIPFLPNPWKVNPSTWNDNTSGVITVLKHYETYKNKDICYVLFDNEEKGLLGSFAMRKYFKGKIFINIDCVGDGVEPIIITKNMKFPQHKTIPWFSTLFLSDHVWAHKSCCIMFVKKFLNIRYINNIHTTKDTILKEENIDKTLKLIEEVISYG